MTSIRFTKEQSYQIRNREPVVGLRRAVLVLKRTFTSHATEPEEQVFYDLVHYLTPDFVELVYAANGWPMSAVHPFDPPRVWDRNLFNKPSQLYTSYFKFLDDETFWETPLTGE